MSNDYWKKKPGDVTPEDVAAAITHEERRGLELVKESNDALEERIAARKRMPYPSDVGESGIAGRYSSKSWSPSFGGIGGGESPVLAGVKASNDPEVSERFARQLHEERGVRGEKLDALVLTENTFRHMTRVQTRPGPLTPESARYLEAIYRTQKSDMGGSVNTSGGYAVPDIVGDVVLKLVRDASLIFSRARQVPMTSDTLSFPDENTAVTINWVAEAGVLTGGEPVFGVKTLTAKKLAGRAVFSLELLDDANVAVLPFLQSCFAEKIGGELDFQAMQGPGTVFTGVLGAVSVGTTNATNGTNGTNITYNGTASTQSSLVKVFVGAGEGLTRGDGMFVCGPGVYAKIIGMVDNNQQPIVRLGTVEGAPNNTILGRPVVVSARLPNFTVGSGTVSVGALFYGSPSALVFGVRKTLTWEVTDQVHWSNYQADARMIGRFGFVVGVPTAWVKQADIIV